jgi:cobalt-zinc-cadmium efflux system membrane fusion protein
MDNQDRISNQGADPERPPIRPVAVKRWVIVVVFVLLVASATAVTWLLTRGSSQGSIAGLPVPAPPGEFVPPPSDAASAGITARPGEMMITLSPDKLENAQLKTEVVAEQTGITSGGSIPIRTTGTVQTNAYKEVPVFPIAGGIVRQINVELGSKVNRGQTLATILSTELADAQAAYLKVVAEVEEHHQHHHRTTELVELGAASREELEQATSMYKTAQATLASATERLLLLGMNEKQVDALRSAQKFPKPLIGVEAPVSGTLVGRAVNTGEVVMQGKEMFRVADLSSVWVIAQIFERDFQTVNISTPAIVTTSAYPARSFAGRVSYIDPRVDPQTRTAQVRIELANPREALKLGMFVDVNFGGAGQTASSAHSVAVVPRSAIQTIGARQVVYLATDRPGSFVQREVAIGQEASGRIPVYSGVNAGERVVTEGSFLLRAESLKVNPAQSTAPSSVASNAVSGVNQPQPGQRSTQQEGGVQSVTITVTADGFQPDRIELKRDVPARLIFVREVEATCATSVTIQEFNVKQDLPFKAPVVVEFTPVKKGTFEFTCGMKMISGKIVVR